MEFKHHKALGAFLGASWGVLGASWAPPGASRVPPGRLLGPLVGVVAASWGFLRGLGRLLAGSWGSGALQRGLLGASWDAPGRVLGASWAILGILGPLDGLLGASWGLRTASAPCPKQIFAILVTLVTSPKGGIPENKYVAPCRCSVDCRFFQLPEVAAWANRNFRFLCQNSQSFAPGAPQGGPGPPLRLRMHRP